MSKAENVERNRRRAREWYARNSDRAKKREAQRRKSDPEKFREYRRLNRESLLRKQREWRRKNITRRAIYQREYCKTAHGKLVFINAAARRRARLRGVISEATTKQIESLLKRARKCHYCGKRFSKSRKKTVDHIVPI